MAAPLPPPASPSICLLQAPLTSIPRLVEAHPVLLARPLDCVHVACQLYHAGWNSATYSLTLGGVSRSGSTEMNMG